MVEWEVGMVGWEERMEARMVVDMGVIRLVSVSFLATWRFMVLVRCWFWVWKWVLGKRVLVRGRRFWVALFWTKRVKRLRPFRKLCKRKDWRAQRRVPCMPPQVFASGSGTSSWLLGQPPTSHGSHADPAQFDDDDTQDQKGYSTDRDRTEGTASNISVSCRSRLVIGTFRRRILPIPRPAPIPRQPFRAQFIAPSPTCREKTGSQNTTAEIVTPR
jgi:hypothetical protein